MLKNKLLIILLAVVLLGGGGGAYYFLVLGKKESVEAKKKGHHEEDGEEPGEGEALASSEEHADDEEETPPTKKKREREEDEDEEEENEEEENEEEEEEEAGGYGGSHGEKKGPVIEPFVVNLADPGSRRYLRLNLKLELKKPEETEPLLEARMPQMRDAVLLLLSSKTTDQLLGPEGKTALRQELIEQINQALNRKQKKKKLVKNLYFTEFLIQ
jgi:flagellar FliL protein